MEGERAAFDPHNAFDACADRLRCAVADLGLEVSASDAFRSLSPADQVSCMMAGLMTGSVGILMAFVKREGHDDLVRAIEYYLSDARQNAEDIAANAPNGGIQ